MVKTEKKRSHVRIGQLKNTNSYLAKQKQFKCFTLEKNNCMLVLKGEMVLLTALALFTADYDIFHNLKNV